MVKDLIATSGSTFEVGATEVLAMKKAGLSDDLISHVIKTKQVAAPPPVVPAPTAAPGYVPAPPQSSYAPQVPQGQRINQQGQAQIGAATSDQGLPPPAPTSVVPGGGSTGTRYVVPAGLSDNPDEAKQPPAPGAQFHYNQRFVNVFELKVWEKRRFKSKRLLKERTWDRFSNNPKRAGSLFFTSDSLVFVNNTGMTVLDLPYSSISSQVILDEFPAEYKKKMHALNAYKLQIEFQQNNARHMLNMMTLPKSKGNRDPEWGTVFDISEALNKYGSQVNSRITEAKVKR